MDRKLETFLTLCKTMNYRATAEELHLTQPAITKQIQALEVEYGAKLFTYDGRKLEKTDKGQLLQRYAASLAYNYEELRMAMQEKNRLHLRVGATKTIGDYVIGPAVMRYLRNPEHELSLTVDNTHHLLQMLDENQMDFAIIEGIFDKTRYDYQLYRNEAFYCICTAGKKIKRSGKKKVEIEDILGETIFVREQGSGTRRLFERDLESLGYGIDSFARVIELNSFQLIRQAVREGLGISFVYDSVAKDDEDLQHFEVTGINTHHEFNVVYLPNTAAKDHAMQFLKESELFQE